MTEIFPVQERLIKGADTNPEAPFLVDIGGSVGHDLVQFQQHFPDHPGKLILEDLDVVLNQIPDPERLGAIKKLPHDFTKPQPVKGKFTPKTRILTTRAMRSAYIFEAVLTNDFGIFLFCFFQAPGLTTCTRASMTGRMISAKLS